MRVIELSHGFLVTHAVLLKLDLGPRDILLDEGVRRGERFVL